MEIRDENESQGLDGPVFQSPDRLENGLKIKVRELVDNFSIEALTDTDSSFQKQYDGLKQEANQLYKFSIQPAHEQRDYRTAQVVSKIMVELLSELVQKSVSFHDQRDNRTKAYTGPAMDSFRTQLSTWQENLNFAERMEPYKTEFRTESAEVLEVVEVNRVAAAGAVSTREY